MQMIIEMLTRDPYHASCLSPILWTIVAMALLAELVGWASDVYDRRRARARRAAVRARDRADRQGNRWQDAG